MSSEIATKQMLRPTYRFGMPQEGIGWMAWVLEDEGHISGFGVWRGGGTGVMGYRVEI